MKCPDFAHGLNIFCDFPGRFASHANLLRPVLWIGCSAILILSACRTAPQSTPTPTPIAASSPHSFSSAKPTTKHAGMSPSQPTVLPQNNVPTHQNLLVNGNFERSGAWECLGGCKLEAVNVQGRSARIITQRSERWMGAAQSVALPLQQNGRYRSSVWLRAVDSVPVRVWVVLEVNTSHGTKYFGTTATPLADFEWQRISGDHYPAWTGDLQQVTWRIETEPPTANLIVDDASFQQIDMPEGDAKGDSLRVYPSRTRQTIQTVAGANWSHRSAYLQQPIDPIGLYNLTHLPIRMSRIVVDLREWQLNPGNQPQNRGDIRETFLLMQLLQEQDIDVVVAFYDLPDWLVMNPASDRQRIVAPDRYPQLVELISGWLDFAQAEYGLNVSQISFNEPDLGVNTHWSSRDMVRFITLAGPGLARRDPPTLFVLGDCHAVANCLHFVQPIWQNEATNVFIGSLAFHSWDQPPPPSLAYAELATFGVTAGLDVMASEMGWNANLWQQEPTDPTFDSWEHALRTAVIYSRVLKLSGVSSAFFWQMLGEDYPTNNGTVAYPVFSVLQQLDDAFSPGTQIVETSPDSESVYALAGMLNGRMALHVINGATEERELLVEGLANGIYAHNILDAAGSVQAKDIAVTRGSVSLQLPRQSISLLQQR